MKQNKLCDFASAECLAGLADKTVDYLRSIFVLSRLHNCSQTNRMSFFFFFRFGPSVTLPQLNLNISTADVRCKSHRSVHYKKWKVVLCGCAWLCEEAIRLWFDLGTGGLHCASFCLSLSLSRLLLPCGSQSTPHPHHITASASCTICHWPISVSPLAVAKQPVHLTHYFPW